MHSRTSKDLLRTLKFRGLSLDLSVVRSIMIKHIFKKRSVIVWNFIHIPQDIVQWKVLVKISSISIKGRKFRDPLKNCQPAYKNSGP